MKPGDKVKLKAYDDEIGIIVEVDDTHRQTFVRVLVPGGVFRMWDQHVEVINEKIDFEPGGCSVSDEF